VAWWQFFRRRSGRTDWLVAGLGNPGERYAGTRHNFGFVAADALARRHGGRWSGAEGGSLERCLLRLDAGTAIEVVRPLAFMNRSGPPVQRALERAGLSPGRLIVLVDDLALPLGTLRIRAGGGDGGHNGLRSLAGALDSADFIRVRLGVAPAEGMPPAGEWVDFVLGRFAPGEEDAVRRVTGMAVSAVLEIIDRGPDAAMGRYNRRTHTD
jgi:PTH1 family peptidyl-tRNA hydrolase